MKSLVIGKGEVGKSLFNVLSKAHPVKIRDKKELKYDPEIIHICFPYSENFVKAVKAYQKEYKPRYTVIHSSVPIGTSYKCAALHSPVRGIHPHLEEGLKTFVKLIGGQVDQKVLTYFRQARITIIHCSRNTRDTEAGKLWSTTQYGLFIILEKLIHDYCEKNKLSFEVVYTLFNETYNHGYIGMGMPYHTRPILKHVPGAIGGHCVIPNCHLLKSEIISNFVIKQNEVCGQKKPTSTKKG